MSNSTLFIPEKIKVGFQERKGTYTGKLAYITYFDKKGVLRSEYSWDHWRDKSIEPECFDNTPTEGFVLNKSVGGVRESWGRNPRNEYVRVYDPRGFEFEIYVPNLLFILANCDCSRGKGLEGKFVYAWGTSKVTLLPVSSVEYSESVSASIAVIPKLKAKDLVFGGTYSVKRGRYSPISCVYLGMLLKRENVVVFDSQDKFEDKKYHVFWDGRDFKFISDMSSIRCRLGEDVSSEAASLYDRYIASIYFSKPLRLFTKDSCKPKCSGFYYFASKEGDKYNVYRYYFSNVTHLEKVNSVDYVSSSVIDSDSRLLFCNRIDFGPYGTIRSFDSRFVEPTGKSLFLELESGTEYEVLGHSLGKPNYKEKSSG